jgi:hypothetical protein
MFAKLRDGDPEQAARFWTPGRLTGMPTEAIVDRLQSMGVDGQRTTFVARTATGTSAWALGDAWRSELPPAGVDRFAKDFLGLAACELWKRYLPSRPSTEMLDDWMQEGYGLEAQRRFEEACDRWQAVWDVLRGRFEPPMRTCGAAEVVFDGTQMLGNWVQDVSMALQNQTEVDHRAASPPAPCLRHKWPGWRKRSVDVARRHASTAQVVLGKSRNSAIVSELGGQAVACSAESRRVPRQDQRAVKGL